MILRPSKFGKDKKWYGCRNYPECDVTAALHPDGTLLSTPADKVVKLLRIQCHAIAGKIWGELGTEYCDKKAMYDYLKANTRTGHIGHLTKPELFILLKKLRKKLYKSHG